MFYTCPLCENTNEAPNVEGEQTCEFCGLTETEIAISLFLDQVRARCGYDDARWLPGATPAKFAALRDHEDCCEMVVGLVGDFDHIERRYFYADILQADDRMTEWDGVGEPKGWFRRLNPHPSPRLPAP